MVQIDGQLTNQPLYFILPDLLERINSIIRKYLECVRLIYEQGNTTTPKANQELINIKYNFVFVLAVFSLYYEQESMGG